MNAIPGITYFISNKWALQASIGSLFFHRIREELDTDFGLPEQPVNVDKIYGMNFDFNSFSIGFQYFFKNNVQD